MKWSTHHKEVDFGFSLRKSLNELLDLKRRLHPRSIEGENIGTGIGRGLYAHD